MKITETGLRIKTKIFQGFESEPEWKMIKAVSQLAYLVNSIAQKTPFSWDGIRLKKLERSARDLESSLTRVLGVYSFGTGSSS